MTGCPSPTSTAGWPTCSSALDVRVDIRAEPFGVPMTTPFAADRDHASYDADAVDDSSVSCNGAPTCSRSSPAGTAARRAPCTSSGTASTSPPAASPASGPRHQPVSTRSRPRRTPTRSSASASGPAIETNPFPAYYSYTAPEPAGLAQQPLRPGTPHGPRKANGSLAILRYDDVRRRSRPEGDAPRVPPERLRSGRVARGLGPRRHGDAMVPDPVEPAPPDVVAQDARQTGRIGRPTASEALPHVSTATSRHLRVRAFQSSFGGWQGS